MQRAKESYLNKKEVKKENTMCGLFDSPKAPPVITPPPEPELPVFEAGSELDTGADIKPSKKGKKSLVSSGVGLGIPTSGY